MSAVRSSSAPEKGAGASRYPGRLLVGRDIVVGLHAEELARMFGVDENEGPQDFTRTPPYGHVFSPGGCVKSRTPTWDSPSSAPIRPRTSSRKTPAARRRWVTHTWRWTQGGTCSPCSSSSFGGNEQFVQSRAPIYAMELVRRAVLGLDQLT